MSTDKRYNISEHGSSSENPDLDWSQIRETITMLALAVAQVESSMKDGEQSVGTLSASFTDMAEYLSQIRSLTSKVSPENLDRYKTVIDDTTANLESNVHSAVVAFQFYDRISQRLDHVCQSLDKLGSLIGNKASLYNPESWKDLQNQIKSSYTMDAERIMFEHILRGHSIEEALEIYRHHFDQADRGKDDQNGDEVELF